MAREMFYVVEGPLATKFTDVFKKWVSNMKTEEGIRPIEWEYAKLDTKATEAFAAGVTLIKCKEMWKGRLKKFLTKNNYMDTGYTFNDLKVYARPIEEYLNLPAE